MANNTSTQAPDLQSILATLAGLTTPAQQTRSNTNTPGEHDETTDDQQHSTPQPQTTAEDPRLRPQSRSTASPKPNIDPATITTWQDGLRCVTKIAAQNAQFAATIRKMMDSQRQNEMRWYAERQALKQSQGRREMASAQASEILRGLSNSNQSDSACANVSNAADLETELAAFDRKIYAAQLQMEVAMTAELKGLGVPFFGTDEGAVVNDGDEQDLVQASSRRPKHSPLVKEKQLRELRRRMIGHLEDLYRD